ncbi:MAG TPA: 2Fe-2S iron-sulfur cluster binding domain-containing protein [Firmicutes bacterium]|nr:2Fe-2S iron-sulfur cluster binding domain-containing protein [Candidatus Fermentithermobacillaceae bacterium]
MVTLRIDGRTIEAEAGTTILAAAKKAGLRIPTLCYLEGINEVGACRVCVVELKGSKKLVTSCNTVVQEGMEILTASPRVRHARRIAVELLLTQHDCNCPTCPRNGNCKLQQLANALGVRDVRLTKDIPGQKRDESTPSIVKDPKKCIMCYRCVSFCDKVQSLGIWRISGTGARTSIEPAFGKQLGESDCTFCGQCVTHCPVGALTEKDEKDKAWDLISDPDKITVAEVAPAVRASWGESLGLSREIATPERLVATMKHLGFQYVFDTCFSADLTIMEEATELLERLGLKDSRAGVHHEQPAGGSVVSFESHKRSGTLPLFTSCCPAWVRFAKTQYPELLPNISSAKSPQQMFGAVAKTYYAKILGVPAEKISVISVMPCTAKKYEAGLSVMNQAGTGRDVDLVLTTRELCAMIKEEGVQPERLAEEKFDSPLGVSSGAGVIFGATGGVMEAALRTAYYLVTGKNPDPDAFKDVRGLDGWKEAQFELPGRTLSVAVAHGLGNARRLIEALKQGRAKYDFVEIMACPGGCAGGGGQPILLDDDEITSERSKVLYALDNRASVRFCHENPAIKAIYRDFLGEPGSELAHRLLHTDQSRWEITTCRRKKVAHAADSD